jgi:hypothetical protein
MVKTASRPDARQRRSSSPHILFSANIQYRGGASVMAEEKLNKTKT